MVRDTVDRVELNKCIEYLKDNDVSIRKCATAVGSSRYYAGIAKKVIASTESKRIKSDKAGLSAIGLTLPLNRLADLFKDTTKV